MGATESISQYEIDHAWTYVPAPEGVDIDTENQGAETQSAQPQTPPEAPPQEPSAETPPEK